jgi:antitoxin component of MazEF toxin-antitoxin module
VWSSGEFLYICCVARTDFEISNRYLGAIDGLDHWHEQGPIVVIDIVDALGVEQGRTVVCPCRSNQRTVVRPKPAANVIAHIRAVRGKEPQVRQPRQITQRN